MSDETIGYAELLQRARQGDRAALAQLAEQYEPRVRVVARVLLGPALRPHLDSVDLVQSVHRSLMMGLRNDKFDITTPEQMLALALTVVRRKVARHWRHLQRQKPMPTVQDESGNLAPCLISLSSPREDPAQQAQFNDQIEHLCRHLNETERKMLEMRSQGYGMEEIARTLGVHPVALRVRMSRLRQRLKANGVLDEWV